MPDICDLILDDHETLRRRFAELDEDHDAGPDRLATLWGPVAELLDLHAAAEEAVFYPALLEAGAQGEEETDDAIGDHNDIRDAVRRASGAAPGSDGWWEAVGAARQHNSEHMAEEERGALADMRQSTDPGRRAEMGSRWLGWRDRHAGLRGVDTSDVDPGEYIEQHR